MIKDIRVRQILDSRGEPTIEVGLRAASGRFYYAQIPSGKSRGSSEAKVLPFGAAKDVLGRVRRHIIAGNFRTIRSLDNALIRLDGTRNKSKLGGNLMLGISIAFARMLAGEKKKEVWNAVRSEFFKKAPQRKPYLFSNLINGGAHAATNLQIQEFMVVVKPKGTLKKSVEALTDLYEALGILLKKKNRGKDVPLGDEKGYAMNFKDNFEPIAILESIIRKKHLQKSFALALDSAATNFATKSGYLFEGKKISRDELLKHYLSYLKKSELLFSMEDPFAENDVMGFSTLRRSAQTLWVVGDDITVTNPQLIGRYGGSHVVNSVIIKPNQIGTVSETCDAISAARRYGLKVIVSHRSGETQDTFVAHLARACGADGVKFGAPAKERLVKYRELARIYG